MLDSKSDVWSELDSDLHSRFVNLCEKNEWFPLLTILDVGYEISFLSPYPEVEWVVRAPTIRACVEKAVIRNG